MSEEESSSSFPTFLFLIAVVIGVFLGGMATDYRYSQNLPDLKQQAYENGYSDASGQEVSEFLRSSGDSIYFSDAPGTFQKRFWFKISNSSYDLRCNIDFTNEWVVGAGEGGQTIKWNGTGTDCDTIPSFDRETLEDPNFQPVKTNNQVNQSS